MVFFSFNSDTQADAFGDGVLGLVGYHSAHTYQQLWDVSAFGIWHSVRGFAPCTTMVEPAFSPRSGVSGRRGWWGVQGPNGCTIWIDHLVSNLDPAQLAVLLQYSS